MPNDRPVWKNDIETYFSQADIGCMRDVNARPRLNLGSYRSVKDYIQHSDRNKQTILQYLKDGTMPQGGPQWDDDQFNRFKAWVEDGCPKSKRQLSTPPARPG